MPRWETRADFGDIPPEVIGYDARIHGAGIEGITRWKRTALEWLDAHPGARLPCADHPGAEGSSVFGVIKTCRDLKMRE